MTFRELGQAKYIALETFKKNGQGVITPLWVVGKEDKLYAWTDGDSWKVKRIRNNSQIRVCQSDARGKPESEWFEGQARILESAEDDKTMRQQLASKYGLQFRMMYLLGKVTRRGSTQVVIEISALQAKA